MDGSKNKYMSTPQAQDFQKRLQDVLVEKGYATQDDMVMSEYLLVMLFNHKTPSQVSEELKELMGPDFDDSVVEWLFAEGKKSFPELLPDSAPPASTASSTEVPTTTANNHSQSDFHDRRHDQFQRRRGGGNASGPYNGPYGRDNNNNYRNHRNERGIGGNRNNNRRNDQQQDQQKQIVAQMKALAEMQAMMMQQMNPMAMAQAQQQMYYQQYSQQQQPHQYPAITFSKPPKTEHCRHTIKCTRASCPFSHPSPACTDESFQVQSTDACEKQIECTDGNCTDSHVSPALKKLRDNEKNASNGTSVNSSNLDAENNTTEGNPHAVPYMQYPAPGAPSYGYGYMPAHPQPLSQTPCRFGAKCARPDCVFTHPWNKSGPPPNAAEIPCKFGDSCRRRPNCAFSHPSVSSVTGEQPSQETNANAPSNNDSGSVPDSNSQTQHEQQQQQDQPQPQPEQQIAA